VEKSKENVEKNLPENVVLDVLKSNTGTDGSKEPLKEVLVDDTKEKSIHPFEFDIILSKELNKVSLHVIKNDSYIFVDEHNFYEVKKQPSITKALEKISFGTDSINIEYLGMNKFKITKN
jgi:hypothetical protein